MADLLVLAWVDFQPRTQALGEALGGEVHFVRAPNLFRPKLGKLLMPLRYLHAARETWKLLESRIPRTVIVVSPPVFAPLVAWLWARKHASTVVMDCHTLAYQGRKWRWSRGLHKWLGRRVGAVTLHSEVATAEMGAWGGQAIFLPDDLPVTPSERPRVSSAQGRGVSGRPKVVMAGSLDEAEPVEAEIEAARLLPDVDVIFTGDHRRLPRKLVAGAPSNVTFAGWLPNPEFLAELDSSDVVAAMCTVGLAVNRAAYEALGLSKPLVLSDQPAVRERFADAALFCPNQAEPMARTLRQAIDERATLTERSALLQAHLREDREEALDRLRGAIASGPSPITAGPGARRVLMVSQHDYPSHPVLRRNADFLVSEGIEVDLVCVREDRVPDAPPHPLLHLHQIKLKHRRSSALLYPIEYLRFLMRAITVVLRLARSHRYAAAQVDTVPDFLVLAALPLRWRRSRVVLYMYELMPEMTASRLSRPLDHPVVRLVGWLERRSIALADHVIIVNEPCRRLLVGRGVPADKVTVVLNTPPSLPEGERQPAANPVLITHATLIRRYGVQVAIEAMAILREQWPNLTLEILGSGDYREVLIQLAGRLGVDGRCTFLPYMPWLDAIARIRAATIGVVPVIHDIYGELLLPTKLFDYVAQGVPAVASRLTAVVEYFPEGTVSYFDPGDAGGLAACVDELLGDPDRAVLQAARARKILDSMSWEDEAPIYLATLGFHQHLPSEPADS